MSHSGSHLRIVSGVPSYPLVIMLKRKNLPAQDKLQSYILLAICSFMPTHAQCTYQYNTCAYTHAYMHIHMPTPYPNSACVFSVGINSFVVDSMFRSCISCLHDVPRIIISLMFKLTAMTGNLHLASQRCFLNLIG